MGTGYVLTLGIFLSRWTDRLTPERGNHLNVNMFESKRTPFNMHALLYNDELHF